MKDRAEIIANIVNTLLNSDDIDGAVLRLSTIIEAVNPETAQPQASACQAAYSPETPSL